ncbi:hypothetical protein FDG04_11130 [Clostridium sporogenes]|uniref:hypothetical protein n=1 Tax=Clostridium sporogenes TaxID=1509 RepID=UPI0013D84493|nr:hypothetical protein [Clostridium sporogenes]MBA4510050.1 hypothetical protein [Clostridium sporogenes]MDU6337503.1 hypothetical protein [Clostridium sporogenes]NFQ85843.1 hypothetical protein [Clostridium sporogenes]
MDSKKEEMKINSFEKRKLYKKVNAKKRNELDNADSYLKEIVRLRNEEKLEEAIKNINNEVLDGKYVWALFGKINETDEICLQVGASMDIRSEIIDDINTMYCEDDPIDKSNETLKIKSKNTQFYENVYKINNGDDKNRYIYRIIRQKYKELIFYAIDIDVYLGIKDFKCDNKVVNDILDLSKMYYAETKFAYDTQAIYWYVYKSGVGVKTLERLLEEE